MAKVYRYRINNTVLQFSGIIYIDPNGSDLTGNGTQTKPFRTIKKAVSMVTLDNTAIVLNEGTYNERVNSYKNNTSSQANCLFSANNYKISFIGKGFKTVINTEFIQTSSFIATVGKSDCNVYNLIVNVKCSYTGDNTSNCFVAGNDTYSANLNLFNCAFNFIPSVNQVGIYYDNTKGKVSATNCIFSMGSDNNSWTGNCVGTSVFTATNCIFKNIYDWRSFAGGNKPPHMSLTNCIKNNNNYWNTYSTMTDGGGNIIFDVIYNINYYPTNTTLWLNSGLSTVKNFDNTVSNIGPYGGIYQWSDNHIVAATVTISNITNIINKGEKCNFNFNISPAYIQNYTMINDSLIQSFNDNSNVTYLYNINKNLWNSIKKFEIL
jgi:hypothetical protein